MTELLGHKNSKITGLYTHLAEKAYKKYNRHSMICK